eukprot:5134097-Amphidinium_carterae.5
MGLKSNACCQRIDQRSTTVDVQLPVTIANLANFTSDLEDWERHLGVEKCLLIAYDRSKLQQSSKMALCSFVGHYRDRHASSQHGH